MLALSTGENTKNQTSLSFKEVRQRGVPLRGINRRLTFLALLIVTVVLVMAYLYEGTQHQRLNEEIIRGVIESPQGPKVLLKEFIIRKMKEGDIKDLREDLLVIQRLGFLQHICIYDSSGRLWFRSGVPPMRLPVFNNRDLVCTSCHGYKRKYNPDNFIFALQNEPECQSCHDNSKEILGYIYGRLIIPGMNLFEQGERRQYLFIYFIIGAIVLFIGGGYIHYYIVRRLQAINRAITSFDAGHWQPVKDRFDDEIGEISRSFNKMAERIISTQAELNESRAYLKNLLDNMTDMVIVIDREHKIRYVNRATLEFLRKKETEIIGRECHRVFHDSPVPCYLRRGPERDECGFLAAFKGRRGSSVHKHRTEKGNTYIHVQYIPFYQEGKILYMIEMARDITETYKLNEEKRILSEYNAVLQNVTDMSSFVDWLSRLGRMELKAEGCSLFIYDRKTERLKLLNRDSVDPALRVHIEEMELDECVSIHAIESGEPFVAERPEEFPEGRLKALLREAGVNQIISIPIKEGSRVVGVYNLAYKEAFHFRKEDSQFFALLMETINRVYQRIRHYEEIKEHGERLTTIIEVVNTINRTSGYDDVLDRLTFSVKRILNSHISGVLLYDKDKTSLHVSSIQGVDMPLESLPVIPVKAFNLKFSRMENSFSSINLFKNERWRPLNDIARLHGFKSFYARVLFSTKNEKLGILFSLWRDEYLPSLEDIAYFNIFSEHAEIALEKALLQAEIEKEKNNWENTFNSFSDPLFITDRSFNIIKHNKAFAEFVGAYNLLGKKCYEVVHGTERPLADCPHYETILHKRTAVREFYQKETNRHLVYTTALIKGMEGEYRVVHHIKDVSFLKQLEDERDRLLHQLVQAQKMEAVGNLAGGIAHDFNNILTGILGHAELAEMKLKDDSIRENLAVIKKAAERARDFTKQLLLFGRKAPLEKKVQDLNRIVKESMKLINRLIGEDIELEFALHEELLYVDVDAAQITQVIMNLAVNARDAMPYGGKLTIKTGRRENNEKKGRYALIVVQDTGTGIPEDIKDRIFEPFFTTKQEGRGTGLGLSVVYSVIDRHGGYIELRSSPDNGTTFEVYLPDVDVERGYSVQMREDESMPGGNASILLVDDEEIIRDTGKMILESLGYSVTTAKNGKEALEIYKNSGNGFDLVLSDMIMPEMRGTELYRELSKIRPDVKFILITGYGRHQISSDVRDRIRAVIEKPFNIKEVAYRIRDVLDGRI